MKNLLTVIVALFGGWLMVIIQPVFGWLAGLTCCVLFGGLLGYIRAYVEDSNP